MAGTGAGRLRARARLEALLARHWWRWPPSALSLALRPLSALYGLLARADAMRKRRAAMAGPRLPVPVLVVGNLIAGGAGKTPTVIALVPTLQAAGWRPGIVSRGYGRDTRDGMQDAMQGGMQDAIQDDNAPRAVRPNSTAAAVGDEPLLMARRTGVPVWVGSDRSAAARALCAAHPEVNLLLADDGLQHHALARDVEVLVFDERGLGNGLLLPAGPLREAPGSASAWGVPRFVLYTGGQRSTPLSGALALRAPAAEVWPLAAWWVGDARAAQPLASLQGRSLLALAGIAAPQKFYAPLSAAGLDITPLPQPDHADYRSALPWPPGTADVITTEKDAVKLDPARCGATRVWVLPLDLSLPAGFVADVMAALGSPLGPTPDPSDRPRPGATHPSAEQNPS